MGEKTTVRVLWSSVLVGSLLSCVVCYRLATQALVLGSLEGGWTYKYLQGFHFRPTAEILVRVWVLGGLACLIPLRVVRRHQWWAVFGCLAIGFVAQEQLRSRSPYRLDQIFVSDGSSSLYSPTQQYSPRMLLAQFNRLRPSLPTHARSNMPGKLMLVYALEEVSNSPAVLAWLVVLLSDLGGILLYVFVRDLFADRVVALISFLFYLFVPAKLFFFPVLNTVTPVLVLLVAYLWLRWLRSQTAVYAALLGVTLYLLIFFEPTPLVMGLLFAAFTVQGVRRTDLRWSTLLTHLGVLAAAFVLTYVCILASLGFDLIATLREVAADAVAFNAAYRPYVPWVRRNPVDFMFGVGVCQALVFAVMTGLAVRRISVRTGRSIEPIAVLSLALAGVLVATDLIGANRGEVVRLWIFLACFFQIPAAYACATLDSRMATMLVLGTMLLQDALGTAMFNFAQP